MKTHEKIRELRENLDWSQEKMAEQLHMSANGYAKIERGETKLKLDKLEQIAQIFNIDIAELLSDKGIFVMMNENSDNNKANYYNNNPISLVAEIEKLNAIIEQKDLLLSEKERQIQMLNDFIKTLKGE
ncbi:helix-turn-helix domain-containing protein [Moraxella bovis]|uniref:Helix-turn-helix domain-containing protein n=2 Tax=Moraxella TaxID=475 RepID=A0AAQ2T3P2_MORBO|nr:MULTISPECIES: helix-turn-helix transcriptional regulator [Moraxella]AWY20483.1 XRE family transcriptional regulator [Moraxella bovis]OOR87575.1 transcriptional regulator [Moraxella bovis]UYZ76846.1 helix-turn-helix domain-containing protein [Moraxella bovis]UYZ77204.1 helix-turn-helix domain-containing protein [Moraxella bovis]UYZ82308.1 helix-turn-helix domain-containing protein [Moraxella bovis]